MVSSADVFSKILPISRGIVGKTANSQCFAKTLLGSGLFLVDFEIQDDIFAGVET